MDEHEKPDPLRELGERLDKARRAQQRPERAAPSEDTGSALAFGMRVGLELVVAIVVAVLIGWALDHWLGTRPWGTIGFFFLGVAAGMVNVYRTVRGLGMAVGYRRDRTSGPETKRDEDED
ncbi:MAG TPA: AtpZ/AtpI family protein [Stellaceae bacterium]|nr:AtpZ/AtpI family protein [Stellaceae bacterium]